jgi:2-polyprenyl-6-hydroxyphenyl methylase/3-demethylubiquinone-9 3-methyltransferase
MVVRSQTDEAISIAANEFIWNEAGLAAIHNAIAPIIIAWLKQTQIKTILDLGCGNGAFTALLASKGFEVTGCDMSKTGIIIAREQYPNISWCEQNLQNPLPNEYQEKFDAVISVEVIEHLLLPRQLIKNANFALKPNGLFIITTPYHGYLKNLALALTNQFDNHWHPLRDFGHIKFFSKKTIMALFEEFNFSNIQYTTVGRIPPLARSMIIAGTKNP